MGNVSISGYAFVSGIIFLILYSACGVIYRLYFHPLAKFPGPKLAASSSWYEFYHDIVHRGQLIWQIHKLHDIYGPIVRINPNELHIKDSEFYDEIYAPSSKKRDKLEQFVVGVGAPGSAFSAVGHNLHRLRRSALNPFFSKRAIATNEAQIRESVEKLCRRFKKCAQVGEVVRLDAAYIALTMDVITQYAFGFNDHYLDAPDFGLGWKETIMDASANTVLLRMFPWLLPIIQSASPEFVTMLDKRAGRLVSWQRDVRAQVDKVMAMDKAGKRSEGTIFQSILDSDLPEHEKTAARLTDEAQILVGAGSETTAKSLAFVSFFLASDPAKYTRLRDEVRSIKRESDGSLALSKLEKLPYLTACITEGIRMISGVTTRLPRVAHEPLQYKKWTIPTGTPISQMNYMVNNDPEIFPDPFNFHPERWIEAEAKGEHLERFMVSFSKGSRQCVAINLAWAELYLALAYVVSDFDLELFDTNKERDVMIHSDCFVGVPSPEARGIRVKFVEATQSL